MMASAVILNVFLALTVLGVVGILMTRNLIYAAFLLVLVFLGTAGLFVMANADFVAITQILVYVGGVLILLVFGIMLTNRIEGVPINTPVNRLLAGLLLSVSLFIVLARTAGEFEIKEVSKSVGANFSADRIGMSLLTDYLLIFELVGLVLLVALIGAATVARFKQEGHG